MTDVRQQVQQLWKMVYASGISSALRGLNVLSYLFMLREFEERSKQPTAGLSFGCPVPEPCRWSVIKQMASEDGEACSRSLRTVGAWLQTLDRESCLGDALTPYTLSLLAPAYIQRVMTAIDVLCSGDVPASEVFEEILAFAAIEGAFFQAAGQVMTPPHIAHLMADLLRPLPKERVMETHCGTGNLLLAAGEYPMRSEAPVCALLADGCALGHGRYRISSTGPSLLGCDYSPEMLPSCYTHLLLSGVDQPRVWCSDALGQTFNRNMQAGIWGEIDVVLGNPPYNGFRDRYDRGETLNWLETEQTEVLFVELTLQLLRNSGRAALLLPEGVYRNTSKAAVAVRKRLCTESQIHAVVSLPAGVFLPHASINTSLVLFTKGGCTVDDIWFYRVSQDGFSFNAQRAAQPAHTDLWDLRLQYAAVLGCEPPFQVSTLCSADWWEQYVSSEPAQMYVTPAIEEGTTHRENGESGVAGQRLTGFMVDPATVERSWFVSPNEIAEQHYSLCADTYREKDETSWRVQRKTRRT